MLKINHYVIIFIVLLFSCKENTNQGSKEPPAKPIMNVVQLSQEQMKNAEIEVGLPQVQTMNTTIRLNGVVDVPPSNKISVSNPFGGYVKEMNLLPGTRVKRGSILALMEDPQYIQLQQDYLMAKARLEYLESDYNRQMELNKDKSISDKAFQGVKSEYVSQKILLKSLFEKLKLIHVNPDQLSEKTISRTIPVYSPIQGHVSIINVNIGKYVNPTDVLFELVDERDLHAGLIVFEKDLSLIQIGQKLKISATSNPNKKYDAHVHIINKTLNDDRSSEVHCDIDNADNALLPGMYISADIQVKNANVVSVPESAVVSWDNKQFVFIEKAKGVFEMKQIESNNMVSNGFVEVKNIDQNQRLAIKNAYSLLMQLNGTAE